MNWDKVVQELAEISAQAQRLIPTISSAENRHGWQVRYHTAEVMRKALLKGLELPDE
jgi:hypothetical protein